MHVAFIPYGKKECVDYLLTQLSCQKHLLQITKDNGDIQKIWIEGQVRILPFGIYEYVFPETDKDMVLTSLDFHKDGARYGLKGFRLKFLRKILKLSKIPSFDNSRQYVWIKDNVEIIPVGVRYDVKDFKDSSGTHEAI